MTKSECRSAPADFDTFWVNGDSIVVREEATPPKARQFDLEERTARFGEAVIVFAKRIPQHPANDRLINQIVGAGTSIGANYCEADDAVSRKEFLVNISRCRKEARETKFFLRMIATAEPELKVDARKLWSEAKELHLIFSAIVRRK